MHSRVLALLLVAGLSVGGCADDVSAKSKPGGLSDRSPAPEPTPQGNAVLTDHEYTLARGLAWREMRLHEAEGAVITDASVTVGYGKMFESNVGYACTSGRLLYIKLIGDFPRIVTTGHPVLPGEPVPDFTVHAVLITADAESGRACLIGVQTGDVAPAPGAVTLPMG